MLLWIPCLTIYTEGKMKVKLFRLLSWGVLLEYVVRLNANINKNTFPMGQERKYLMSPFSKKNYLTWCISIEADKQAWVVNLTWARSEQSLTTLEILFYSILKVCKLEKIIFCLYIFFNIPFCLLCMSIQDIFILINFLTYNNISLYFGFIDFTMLTWWGPCIMLRNTAALHINSKFGICFFCKPMMMTFKFHVYFWM